MYRKVTETNKNEKSKLTLGGNGNKCTRTKNAFYAAVPCSVEKTTN